MYKIIAIIFLFPIIAFSQNINYYGRSYSDAIPEAFKMDVSKLRVHIDYQQNN